MNGWFKFHRKTFENPMIMKDTDTLSVWVWLLGNATFDERRVLFGGVDRKLNKGELVTTAKFIANELKINESKVNRILKMLENEKQIEKQTTSRNTLIYIVNWEKYQSDEKQNEKQVTNECKTNEEQMKDERQTSEEQMTTIQESNNDKNIENEKEEECEEGEEVIITATESINHSDIKSVLEAWNELERYGIRAVKKLKSTTNRYTMLSARISEYGIEDVLTAIENIKHSGFLKGKNNKGWTITFDWFVRPNNFPKVLEGNYTDNSAQNKETGFTVGSRDEQFQRLMEQIRRDEENANRGC